MSSVCQSPRSSERSRRRGTANPSSPAPTAMPRMACCSASGKAAAPHPPASSAAPTASINRRIRLFRVITARIPSALSRAPLPVHEKPRRQLGRRTRSDPAGGLDTAFYSISRRTASRQNWMIAVRIGPVSGRAPRLSRANSCGWAGRLQRPGAFVCIADLLDNRSCCMVGLRWLRL